MTGDEDDTSVHLPPQVDYKTTFKAELIHSILQVEECKCDASSLKSNNYLYLFIIEAARLNDICTADFFV